MNSAVTTVHHSPPPNVVMTPAAHTCVVASEALPNIVPVTAAVARSTTASAMLNGMRRMNPLSVSAVERSRPFGSVSVTFRSMSVMVPPIRVVGTAPRIPSRGRR